MKKIIRFGAIFLLFVLLGSCISVKGLTDVTDIGKKDTLKILAIGNSFSEDATEYIPMIARDCGVKNIVVGNMYIGGCTIETHAANARENKAAYKYYKNTAFSLMSVCPTTKDVTLETALKDEEWDVVTLQNSSVHSGQIGKYNKDLDYMIDYVKTLCPNAKLGWHMTWAYETGYDGSSFTKYYKGDELYMYESILNCVQTKIVPNEKIDFIIPSGTAIQNARTSFLGDKLTRDGLHLTLDYGRYIVGVTWLEALGFDTSNLKSMPNRMRPRVLPFIHECVDNAFASPFEITQSVHWYEPGTTPPATEAPATEAPVTEAATDKIAVTENEVTVPDKSVQTEDSNATVVPGEDNTGLIIGIVSGVAVVAVCLVSVAVKRKKK